MEPTMEEEGVIPEAEYLIYIDNIKEFVSSKNYPFEMHKTTTEDGYNLTLFRIPGPKNSSKKQEEKNINSKENNDINCNNNVIGRPILFQHGLFDSSDGWLCNDEARCLPFIMANSGYDVWLANSRGNKYSRSHNKYDVDSFEFWQYSFHEMGKYDLPANIKYIESINKTKKKIIYIGHSQGTTSMFSALTHSFDSITPHICLFVALAPVCRLSNMASGILTILEKLNTHRLLKKASLYELLPAAPPGGISAFFREKFSKLANIGLNLISEENSKEVNDSDAIKLYMKKYPCGTSLKSLTHYVQILKSKEFCYYDYKREANFVIYNQITPPPYDLSKIANFPIMLIGGENDKLGDKEDVKWLNGILGNNVIYYKIEPKMGHVSFLLGKSVYWFREPLKIIMNQFQK